MSDHDAFFVFALSPPYPALARQVPKQQPRPALVVYQIRRRPLGYLNCLVSCDHVPRRSWSLFRAKAMLGELIAGLSNQGIQSHQEQLAA